MATLPYSRVVDVNLTRQDNFPTRAGFGVPLIVTTQEVSATINPTTLEVSAAIDATTLVATFGTLAEVEATVGVTGEIYETARTIFSQNPSPNQVKVGFVSAAAATGVPTDVEITTGMSAIEAFDDGFYWVIPTQNLFDATADQTAMVAFAEWIETRTKLLVLLSDDANTESVADTTNIAARLQALELSRTTVAYHDLGDQLQAGIVAYGATRNFDDANSRYTMKFKGMSGIRTLDRNSGAVQAVTGFVPGLGLDATQGHFANAYVNVGGESFVTEGSMADGGFIDEIHFQDWLISRTQEEVLAVFLNTPSVEYSDRGFNLIAQAVQRVLNRAQTAGLIVDYEDTNGDIVPWNVAVPRAFSVAASQRRQRIMPAIEVTFRYAGSIHYSTINYTMTF